MVDTAVEFAAAAAAAVAIAVVGVAAVANVAVAAAVALAIDAAVADAEVAGPTRVAEAEVLLQFPQWLLIDSRDCPQIIAAAASHPQAWTRVHAADRHASSFQEHHPGRLDSHRCPLWHTNACRRCALRAQ